MNDQNTYSFLFNGTPFTVTVDCKQSIGSSSFVSLAPVIPSTTTQAPWVTAHRVAHLPSR